MHGLRSWRAGTALVAITLGMCAAACSSPQESGQEGSTEPEEPQVWPLTGVAGDDVTDRAALTVKIENSPEARPQTGLEHADIVFEEMVEGGITRFAAVFNSDIPDEVGPIRSLRPMDAAIAAPFGGLFVFSGGQSQFVSEVSDTGLTMISMDGGADGFHRTDDRPAPHNVYGDMSAFYDQADSEEPPTGPFEFADEAGGTTAATAGQEATDVDLGFPGSNPGWSWDGQQWLRTESGEEATMASGDQIHADNVVVLRVEVTTTTATDPAGNPVPETVLTGDGDAQVLSGGHAVEGSWSKPDTADPLQLAGADGEPIELAPGITWVELVPASNGSVNVS